MFGKFLGNWFETSTEPVPSAFVQIQQDFIAFEPELSIKMVTNTIRYPLAITRKIEGGFT